MKVVVTTAIVSFVLTVFLRHCRPSSEPLAQWDSPMQVKLSAWKPGLNTLLMELLPWALLANCSHWDLWLFEGEKIVVQIPAGKVIVPPNFKVGELRRPRPEVKGHGLAARPWLHLRTCQC